MGFVCLKYFLLSLHKAVLSVKDIASADECYGGEKASSWGILTQTVSSRHKCLLTDFGIEEEGLK